MDWWYVPMGALKVVLHDLRPDSPTYRQTQELFMGEPDGSKVLKIPHADPSIGYDWLKRTPNTPSGNRYTRRQGDR